jgi:hypothetical protein
MTTISPLASNDKNPWILLLGVGFVLGHYSHNVAQLVDQLLVPLYTICVTIYLSSRVLGIVIQNAPSLRQPESKSKSVPVPTFLPQENVEAILHDEQPIDLTGAWKLVENNNFEEFLATQGVPWPLRSAANRARPTHRITHRGSLLTIKIEGIIESQTTYIINGPKVTCTVRGRLFEDAVSYLPNGVQVLKRAVEEKYTIQVCRRLSEDQQKITLTSTATFDDGRDSVQSTQLFARMQ